MPIQEEAAFGRVGAVPIEHRPSPFGSATGRCRSRSRSPTMTSRWSRRPTRSLCDTRFAQLQRKGRARCEITVKKGERIPFELTWHPSACGGPTATQRGCRSARRSACEAGRAGRSTRATTRKPWDNRSSPSKESSTNRRGHRRRTDGRSARRNRRCPQTGTTRYCWLRETRNADARRIQCGRIRRRSQWRGGRGSSTPSRALPTSCKSCTGWKSERRLTEFEARWLPGYEPCSNRQCRERAVQLDVYGEVIQALYEGRRLGRRGFVRSPARRLDRISGDGMAEPDDGIWEVRGVRSTSSTRR